MKKFGLLSFTLIMSLAVALAAQAPAGAPGGGGARGGGGAAGAPGGGGGQGARGGRGGGAAIAAAPAPLQSVADALVVAINKQDAAALTKMIGTDAVYLDEDGHALATAGWVTKVTTGTPAKVFAIVGGTHGQMLDDNTGWLSFNYTLAETFQAAPKTLSGTASLALKKAATGEWMIQMIHGALKQSVAGVTQ